MIIAPPFSTHFTPPAVFAPSSKDSIFFGARLPRSCPLFAKSSSTCLRMESTKSSVTVASGVDVSLVNYVRPGIQIEDARRIILLHHGIGEHARRYALMADELFSSTESLDAIFSYDCRGHGQTAASNKGSFCKVSGVDQLVEDFNTVFNHWMTICNPEARFVLMGHSLGGLVMAAVASAKDSPVNGAEKRRISGTFLSAPALQIVVSGTLNKLLVPFVGAIASIPGARSITKSVCRSRQGSIFAEGDIYHG